MSDRDAQAFFDEIFAKGERSGGAIMPARLWAQLLRKCPVCEAALVTDGQRVHCGACDYVVPLRPVNLD